MLQLHGQDLILASLKKSIAQDRFHHAYVLAGASHTGKNTLALQIAQALNCLGPNSPCMECNQCTRIARGEHPDIHIIDNETGDNTSKEIGINAIREFSSQAYLKPFEGKTRVVIINPAEKLNEHSSNALLKILEEPPADVVILLISNSTNELMPTILSRCQLLQFKKVDYQTIKMLLESEYGLEPKAADIYARLSNGSIGWAISASRDSSIHASLHQILEKISDIIEEGIESRFNYCEEFSRIHQRNRLTAETHLRLWLSWLRDILLIQNDVGHHIVHLDWRDTLEKHAKLFDRTEVLEWIDKIYSTTALIERNINPRLALETVLIAAPLSSKRLTQ